MTWQNPLWKKWLSEISHDEKEANRNNATVCEIDFVHFYTRWPRSYRKYILQITQPSQYRYPKLQYRFAVTSGSPSNSSIFQSFIKQIRQIVPVVYTLHELLPWYILIRPTIYISLYFVYTCSKFCVRNMKGRAHNGFRRSNNKGRGRILKNRGNHTFSL